MFYEIENDIFSLDNIQRIHTSINSDKRYNNYGYANIDIYYKDGTWLKFRDLDPSIKINFLRKFREYSQKTA